ncbi:MAG: hypothetical protein EAX87_09585 [Candidatus Thorarchaeota archaeon]|nr:hypothetical protein [Candidatus Thorarchaeota archaeon]
MRNQTKLISFGVLLMILLSTAIILAVYADREGPSIYQIEVLPVDPTPGNTISVIAYASDISGVSSAQLSYSVNGTIWEVQDMSFIACLCATGGRWVGSFGPIAGNSIVMFYVTLYDNSPTSNPSSSQTFSLEINA